MYWLYCGGIWWRIYGRDTSTIFSNWVQNDDEVTLSVDRKAGSFSVEVIWNQSQLCKDTHRDNDLKTGKLFPVVSLCYKDSAVEIIDFKC